MICPEIGRFFLDSLPSKSPGVVWGCYNLTRYIEDMWSFAEGFSCFFQINPILRATLKEILDKPFFQSTWLGAELPIIFNTKKIGDDSGGHDRIS